MRFTFAAMFVGLLLLLGGCEPDPEAGGENWQPKVDYTQQFFTPDSDPELMRSEVLYVPVYSSVLMGKGALPTELAATLAIRNTDPDKSIFVTRVAYHNTNGELIEVFIDETKGLAPLASALIVIDVADRRGGFGANFIVRWGAEGPVNEPIVETIMIGSSGTKGFSFSSPARVIKTLAP